MSQTLSSEAIHIEYKGVPHPSSSVAVMIEYSHSAISNVAVMIEYKPKDDRLKTLPLLGVG